MSWEENLRVAAYNSPSGSRLVFDFEDVSKNLDKLTSVSLFPEVKGTLMRDLGSSGRKFPLRLYFSGEDYDLNVNAFEKMLDETGFGRLEHPIYGVVDVMPSGTLGRRDDLKTAANQAVLEVTFWETFRGIYAGAVDKKASKTSIKNDLSDFNNVSSEQLQTESSIKTVSDDISYKNFYSNQVNSATNSFSPVLTSEDNIASTFSLTQQSMLKDLSSLETINLDVLASQTVILLQLPGRASTINIDDRLSAYQNGLEKIINSDTIVPSSYDKRNENEFIIRDIFAASYITGIVTSVINNQFETKIDALSVANALLIIFDAYVLWRDANYEILEREDTGDMYAALQDLVVITTGFLVELSFTLQTEKRIILNRARSVIELVAELYGVVDEKLDFFINSNDLSGSEILELPRGREIVYYV